MKNQEITWLLKEKYRGMESEVFHADCIRLAAGVPLAYVIGSVPFLDCTIYLDSHPLIPRPETEYWVEQAISAIKKISESNLRAVTPKILASAIRGQTPYLKVLDLCAGSGAIGVAVAKAIPEVHVTFAELDPIHLPTIEKNITKNVKPSIQMEDQREIELESISLTQQFIASDLFSNLDTDTRFDFILSNPPYIDVEANTVDKNVTAHEPHLALFGGEAGMELIARIISEAPNYLTPTGQLWIEHEPAQVEAITSLAHTNNFTIITHPDQYGFPRFSVLTMAQ